jgi:hypothetical protein
MEISPAWRGRYADSYEVLQMHPDCMITPPPVSHSQQNNQANYTFEKKMTPKENSRESSRKDKKKASNLAEEERISNLSEVQLNQGSRSKNNSRLLINDNQY